MTELERFIEFWVGPRHPDCGEPSRVLSRLALPEPLRRLYHFAGRWIPPRAAHSPPFVGHMFSVQDALLTAERLEFTADGKLVFLVENQDVWRCATEPSGDDPPVWVSSDRNHSTWEFVHESLSQFLVSYVLQELLFGSRFKVSDEVSLKGLQSEMKHAIPLWEGSYVHAGAEPYRFSLVGTDLLVGTLHGTTWVSANSDRGIASLKLVEGEINRVHIQYPDGWCLELANDGSGEVRVFLHPNTTARFPPGTIAFKPTVARLTSVTSDEPAVGKCAAFFFRRGQRRALGKPLVDPQIANDLITAAARAAVQKEPRFESAFAKRRP